MQGAMLKIGRKESILEKWYGSQPGGSLHDVYVVEIEGVYEG